MDHHLELTVSPVLVDVLKELGVDEPTITQIRDLNIDVALSQALNSELQTITSDLGEKLLSFS